MPTTRLLRRRSERSPAASLHKVHHDASCAAAAGVLIEMEANARPDALAPTSSIDRLERLCDPRSLDLLEPAGARRPTALVAARGRVDGRPIVCYAQDSSVAGGSVGTAEADVVVRALQLARRSLVPVVAFLESAGARLQEGAAALGGFGRIFHENVSLSGRVPQISVITGTSAGGGCYSPALTDFVMIVGHAAMFLTGPRVVREALGENVSTSALGGAAVHERNGVCQFTAADEADAVATVRELLAFLPQHAGVASPRTAPIPPLAGHPEQLVPADGRLVYDVRSVIAGLVDGGGFLEVSSRWARNLVVGFSRIRGAAVGVVANQPRHLGGVIDSDASEKGARFVRTCDAHGIPLVVLVDTPGFMPGLRQETAGIIRRGAELLRAFAGARVPRVTVVLRKAFGGAYITMNSKDLGADLAVAWPEAEIGIMGSRAAVGIINRRELAVAPSPERLAQQLADAYGTKHLSAARALELGLLDAVIEPATTRERLAAALADAAQPPRVHRAVGERVSPRGGR
jgi:acetyl-CoA carboxylase carboxyltransferase component